jgi:hypothetical protein
MKTTGRNRGGRAGATILESLLACGVLAVGACVATSVMGSSKRIQVGSRYRFVASNLARETMESLRARRCSELVPTDPDRPARDPILPADHIFNTQLAARRTVDITPCFLGPAGAGKRIVVTVTWEAVDLGRGVRAKERLVAFRSEVPPAEWFP